jgi:2-polyprenyl-3-methyl-5-hydroxy-6-metoxy-1,4-benzoquinol methylase
MNCPICKEEKVGIVRDPDFVRCVSCGLLRRAQPLAPDLLQNALDDDLRGCWEELTSADYYANQRDRALSEMPFIREHYPSLLKGGRALDIGCGLGGFLEALNQEGMEASGIDASQPCADFARARGLDVRVARIDHRVLDTFFPGEMFDLISLRAVLGYVDNQGEILALVRRRLKSTGMLYVNDVMASSPYFWFGASLLARLGPYSTVFFDRRSLANALRIYGFRPVATLSRHQIPADALSNAWRAPPVIAPLLRRVLPRMIRYLPDDFPCVIASPLPNRSIRDERERLS